MSITLKLKPKVYSDAAYVEGVKNHDEHLTRELERYCRKYFDEHYRGVFFCGDEKRLEIFQDAFIVLWEKIETGKIYVEDGVLRGKNGKPFTSSLTTYFMGIAKLKNLELTHDKELCVEIEDEEKNRRLHFENFDNSSLDFIYDDNQHIMEEVIAYCISVMSEQCNKILTKFYYEEKDLDTILLEIPTISNKNALKTRKYKCMETLRNNSQSMYKKINNY